MPDGMRRLLREQGSRTDFSRSAGSTRAPNAADAPKEKKRHKYGAIATIVDGIRFDSKKEARYYEQLKLRVQAGEVRYFLRQVPIYLPGGTRLVIDFLEFMAEGPERYVDVKGRETEAFKIKRREVEAAYPSIRIFLA